MNTQLLLMSFLVAAVACGDDKKSKAPESQAGAKTKKEKVQPAPEANKSGLDMFTGSAVALPEPAAMLAFQMPIEEATKRAPMLVGDDKKYGPMKGYKSATASISLTKDKTRLRSFAFTIENSLDELTKHLDQNWGKSVEAKDSKIKRYWTNTEDGLRLWAESTGGGGSRVVYEKVTSFDAFVGTEKAKFGFERIPLLGAVEADVRKAYAEELIGMTPKKDTITFGLPAHEFTQSKVFLTLTLKDGKVHKWQFAVSYSLDATAKEKLLAAFEEKFGKAEKGATYLVYPGPPTLKVDDGGGQLTVLIN